MLELGLGRRLVGTAYLDDAHVYPPLAKAYARVPVLGEGVPLDRGRARRAARPRLRLVRERLSRAPRPGRGIVSRRRGSRATCLPERLQGAHRADHLRRRLRRDPPARAAVRRAGPGGAADRAAAAPTSRRPAPSRRPTGLPVLEVFWYEQRREDAVCRGLLRRSGVIVRSAGARNIFDGIPNGWGDGSWERVLEHRREASGRDRAASDAVWDTAADKRRQLARSPYSGLTAVQRRRFVVIPFGSTTRELPGRRRCRGARPRARGAGASLAGRTRTRSRPPAGPRAARTAASPRRCRPSSPLARRPPRTVAARRRHPRAGGDRPRHRRPRRRRAPRGLAGGRVRTPACDAIVWDLRARGCC